MRPYNFKPCIVHVGNEPFNLMFSLQSQWNWFENLKWQKVHILTSFSSVYHVIELENPLVSQTCTWNYDVRHLIKLLELDEIYSIFNVKLFITVKTIYFEFESSILYIILLYSKKTLYAYFANTQISYKSTNTYVVVGQIHIIVN